MERDFHEEIDRTKKRLANVLNIIEAMHDELEFVFEQNRDWNSEIKWQIEEAATKLGFALATLTNWYDDEPVDKE